MVVHWVFTLEEKSVTIPLMQWKLNTEWVNKSFRRKFNNYFNMMNDLVSNEQEKASEESWKIIAWQCQINRKLLSKKVILNSVNDLISSEKETDL